MNDENDNCQVELLLKVNQKNSYTSSKRILLPPVRQAGTER